MDPIVDVEKLSKSFRSSGHTTKALDSVSLSINKGEVFGLLGPNGAGKTTLISVLCGFLIPDGGTARIFGMDCTRESGRIKKRMNLASGFSGVSDFFNVEELLGFFCMLYNLDKPKERVDRAIRAANLDKYRKRVVADLSSGLSRRFLISKVLLNEPEVLLLDEPTVGLDVGSSARLRDTIRGMKEKGMTILLTTHNMQEAEAPCDRIAMIKDGRIIACGRFEELRDRFFPHEVLEVICDKPERIEKAVRGRASVVKIKRSEGKISLFMKDESDIAAILGLIDKAGVKIKTINTIEPELGQVYEKFMEDEADG
ncbi:MAG: ABC transporter ATP-binding protein [Candidatus Micrarchaeota archaeon]